MSGYFHADAAEWEAQHYAGQWSPTNRAPRWWASLDLGWLIDRRRMPSVRELAAAWGWTRSTVHDFLVAEAEKHRMWDKRPEAQAWMAEALPVRTLGGQHPPKSRGQNQDTRRRANADSGANVRTDDGQSPDTSRTLGGRLARARLDPSPSDNTQHPAPRGEGEREGDPTPTPNPSPTGDLLPAELSSAMEGSYAPTTDPTPKHVNEDERWSQAEGVNFPRVATDTVHALPPRSPPHLHLRGEVDDAGGLSPDPEDSWTPTPAATPTTPAPDAPNPPAAGPTPATPATTPLSLPSWLAPASPTTATTRETRPPSSGGASDLAATATPRALDASADSGRVVDAPPSPAALGGPLRAVPAHGLFSHPTPKEDTDGHRPTDPGPARPAGEDGGAGGADPGGDGERAGLPAKAKRGAGRKGRPGADASPEAVDAVWTAYLRYHPTAGREGPDGSRLVAVADAARIKRAVAEWGAADVVLVLDWAHTAPDDQAAWLQGKRGGTKYLALANLLTDRLPGRVEMAREWDAAGRPLTMPAWSGNGRHVLPSFTDILREAREYDEMMEAGDVH